MISKLKMEQIILHTLNEDTSSFVQLMQHDRNRIAETLAKILFNINEEELKMYRENVSDEITSKLEHISELGKLHDKLKEIPFYKLSERSKLKLEILELESSHKYKYSKK